MTPPPLPVGFTLSFGTATRFSPDALTIHGGSPWRLLRLTDRGADIVARLRRGTAVQDSSDGALARRLVDAGLADPHPGDGAPIAELEVVVPAHDRPDALASCLTALAGLPVVVVDDGSAAPSEVAAVVSAHAHARLIRRDINGGPASARNTGVAATTSAVLAFVDSDCLATPDALRTLSRHLADPCVGAVAPRIVAQSAPGTSRTVRALAVTRSPLDLGGTSAGVRSGGPVPYVPSTLLLMRRQAFDAVGGFDETLRYAEDVDLVWRLTEAGWSVRYDASVTALHAEPRSWSAWLARRFHYGTGAGALARRHSVRVAGPSLRGLIAPLVIAPRLRGIALPPAPVLQAAGVGATHTAVGLARWGLPLWWPVLLAGARDRRVRAATAALLAVGSLAEWGRRRPPVDPVRFLGAVVADDVAYGAGVWAGCLRARTWTPLLPRFRSPVAGVAGFGRESQSVTAAFVPMIIRGLRPGRSQRSSRKTLDSLTATQPAVD